MNAIAWSLIWFLVKITLGVSKDFLNEAINKVDEANKLELEGWEKHCYVVDHLKTYWSDYAWDEKGRSITNMVIELAVNYLKSLGN